MEGTAVTYRCARCGVESAERTCFVFLHPPQNIKCVGCVIAQRQTSVLSRALTAIAVLVSPLSYMYIGHWARDNPLPLSVKIVMACLMLPTALVVHELAHAVTGWLVGLEIGGITIGNGSPVLRFQIGGVQLQLNAWPISGRVYVGCDTERFIRTRVWLVTLMGPLSNALLAWAAAAWWKTFVPLVGAPVVTAWIIINLMMALFSLVPSTRTDIGGTVHRSDGMALLQIPRACESQLESYRWSALLVRGVSRFELEDFAGAQVWLEKALRRVPDNLYVILALGACKLGLEEYSAGLQLLEPLRVRDLPANARAVIGSNIGYALVIANAGGLVDTEVMDRAERATADAIASFPCILSYRSTRALVLAATGRAEEALSLLEYVNYASATPEHAAYREVARAFALRKLGREEEAEKAAALAMRKRPDSSSELRHLGIIPPSAEAQLRLLGKPVPFYLTWLRGLPSSLKEEARNVSENLNQPLDMGQSAEWKLTGVVLALIGCGMGALGVMAVFKMMHTHRFLVRGELIVAATAVGVAALCLNLGYRLVLNRPNRYGSLLSPGVSRVMGICFVMATLLLAFIALRIPPQVRPLGPGVVLAPLVFAAGCWIAGRKTLRNRS